MQRITIEQNLIGLDTAGLTLGYGIFIEEGCMPPRLVHGFRYFDARDLLGFAIVHLDDLAAWNALSTEAQERIIGRTKLSDIELDDAVKPTSAHSALTTIVENGKEIEILRDNMPLWPRVAGRLWYLPYRLQSIAPNPRADA